jgi:hypothetical protein
VTLDIRHIQETASNIEDVVSGDKDLEELEINGGAMLRPSVNFSPFSTAMAQGELKIKKLTPPLKKAIENRKERFDEIKKYKQKEMMGENEKALLEIPPKEKKPTPSPKPDTPEAKEWEKVKELIKKENKDRDVIYQEIAKQNNATGEENMNKIRRAWAAELREKSESGNWIQVPSDNKDFQIFLRSKIGKKLKEKPKPGSWLKIPKE